MNCCKLYPTGSSLAAYGQTAVDDPSIQAIAARVHLEEDPTFTARYPAEQPVDLRIVLRDRTTYDGHCAVTRGEPATPHSDDDLSARFRDLGSPVWGSATTGHLLAGLMEIENIEGFSRFSDILDTGNRAS
jgi:2-methylcitrate dehydratase PrpD